MALGAVLFFSEWDWMGDERSLIRALGLNPQHGEAMLIDGQLLEAVGQLERGLAMKQQALERIRSHRSCTCRSRSRTGICGATTSRSSGRTRRWRSIHSICPGASFSLARTGGKATSIECSPRPLTHAEAYGARAGALEQVKICADLQDVYATGGGADQALDDPHLAVVTARTDAQGAPGERLIAVAIVGGGRGVVDPFGPRHGAEEVSAAGQVLTPVTMTQEAVIADAVES